MPQTADPRITRSRQVRFKRASDRQLYGRTGPEPYIQQGFNLPVWELIAGPRCNGFRWVQLVLDHYHRGFGDLVHRGSVVSACFLSTPRRQKSGMVSENSGDIWHHLVHLDGTTVPSRRCQQQSLLRFIGLDFLQPGPPHDTPVVHLLHSRSSDGVLRMPLCVVLL